MPVYYLDYEDAHNATEDSKDPIVSAATATISGRCPAGPSPTMSATFEGTRFSDMTEEEKSHVDALPLTVRPLSKPSVIAPGHPGPPFDHP